MILVIQSLLVKYIFQLLNGKIDKLIEVCDLFIN